MSTQSQIVLEPELLNDYFSEADQHLLSVRQALVGLEAWVGSERPDPAIIEELLQNFHSFKGISAIVGLSPAEMIAHSAEEFLRNAKNGTAPLTEKGLEALTIAAQKLEQIVAAFRTGEQSPAYDAVLAELKRHCQTGDREAGRAAGSSSPAGVSGANLASRLEEAKKDGMLLWKCSFSPSQELRNQGVSVDVVRERLAGFGEILRSVPVVRGQGEVVFDFLVAAKEAPADVAAWEALGVKIQPAENEAAQTKSNAAATEGLHSPFLAPSHFVRADLTQLDELMRIAGEMVIHRLRLETQLTKLAGHKDVRGLQEVSASLGRSVRDLRAAIMRIRLVPAAEIFARMPFVVRDLARQTQKEARLKLEGQETAIDKYLIERLKDPLLHLVRNAFSHGVETPAERSAAGKLEEAIIELRAQTSGDTVLISVRDNGKGINPQAIVQRAAKLGLEVPKVVDDASILKILCSSGFSTRDDADRAAGRGIGMAVVAATVRELGGALAMESQEGVGTQFTLRLPLTLAIAETLIVRAAGQTCAVPQNFVREIFQSSESQVERVNGIEALPYRTGVLPIVRLGGLFRLGGPPKPKMYVLVIASERGCVGLVTEEILGQREVVVQALRDPLVQVPGISGATELGDGRPVLILDGAALASGSVMPLKETGSPTPIISENPVGRGSRRAASEGTARQEPRPTAAPKWVSVSSIR